MPLTGTTKPSGSPAEEKARRCEILQKEADAIRAGFLQALVGSEQNVLFETPKGGFQRGYTENYTPVRIKSDEALTGRILKVKITGIEDSEAVAVLL